MLPENNESHLKGLSTATIFNKKQNDCPFLDLKIKLAQLPYLFPEINDKQTI